MDRFFANLKPVDSIGNRDGIRRCAIGVQKPIVGPLILLVDKPACPRFEVWVICVVLGIMIEVPSEIKDEINHHRNNIIFANIRLF